MTHMHDLQEEPESTIGSKPMHEAEAHPEPRQAGAEIPGGTPEFGASHLRHEEGEETEDGAAIRAREYQEDSAYSPPVLGEGEEM